jgi:hypothetical protein
MCLTGHIELNRKKYNPIRLGSKEKISFRLYNVNVICKIFRFSNNLGENQKISLLYKNGNVMDFLGERINI